MVPDTFVFPQDDPTRPDAHSRSGGLTLRQLYAGLIYVGSLNTTNSTIAKTIAPGIARDAVILADILIAELAKPTTEETDTSSDAPA